MSDVVRILDRLTEMVDFPASFAGRAHDAVKVNAGADALEFYSLGVAQWGYLAAMNQGVASGDNVIFTSVSVDELAVVEAPAAVDPVARFVAVDTVTDTMFDVAYLLHVCWPGQMVDGFGTCLRFDAEDQTSGQQVFGRVGFVRDSADNEGKFVVYARTDGNELVLEIDHDGHYDLQAGNLLTTGTLACGAITSTGASQVGTLGVGGVAVDALHVFDASADSSPGIIVSDTTAQAAGVGGGIAFWGKYTDAGAETTGAQIRTNKETGTTGEYGFNLELWTRPDGGILARRMVINSTGVVDVVGDLTAGTIQSTGIAHFMDDITVDGVKAHDIATNANPWDDAYADDWHNVADVPFLDDVDDIAVLQGICSSEKINPRNGLRLIDDSTIPDWMITKNKNCLGWNPGEPIQIKRESLHDSEGNPWISNNVWFGLLRGGIVQLADNVNALEERVRALEVA